jgi:hypothetical protein
MEALASWNFIQSNVVKIIEWLGSLDISNHEDSNKIYFAFF